MNSKRTKVSLVLFFLVGVTCTALWLARSSSVQGRAPSVSQDAAQMADHLAGLNRKAKATKSADPSAVRGLTDEVFTIFAPTEIPPFTQEAMRDRVARAEVNYRQRADKGIPEFKVAKTVNELAVKFEIPDYAKVSPAMVRTVRVGLMLKLSNLIAQDDPGDKQHKKKIGSSINPFMSPLEAATVTMFLLQQKMINDSFQVSHKQFFADRHKQQLQEWGAWRTKKHGTPLDDGQPEEQPDQKMRVVSNSKIGHASRAAKRAADTMNPDALLNLADSSLDTLGIKR